MNDRIASSLLVTALLRLAEREGGFGAVMAKGDANAGAIIVVVAERGKRVQVLERLLQASGSYAWGESMGGQNEAEFDKFLERRRRFDPDLWIVELDIPSTERFAAEMSAFN
jgi:hypothetical protein